MSSTGQTDETPPHPHGTSRPVTACRDHDTALYRLRTTLEHIGKGICVFDAERLLLLCNRDYGEVYRIDPRDLPPGTTLAEIVTLREQRGTGPAMGRDSYLAWRYGLRPDIPLAADVKLQDGRVVHVVHRPMPDGGWVATHEDVTDRRLHEETAAEARQLEAVGRLTGGIAHDFNNLLQTIGTALEMSRLALRPPEGAEMHQLLADATQAVHQGGRLTQQLLAFSRRQMLLVKPVDLWQLVLRAQDPIRQFAPATIAVVVQTDVPPLPCLLDDAHFHTALLNLARNACDAMPDGGTLRFGAEPVALSAAPAARLGLAAGPYARLDVIDTGHGIPAPDLPHVFEPYFTTRQSHARPGLGLPQVHGFTHQSGGSVQIRSQPGSGTTVSIWLPLATEL